MKDNLFDEITDEDLKKIGGISRELAYKNMYKKALRELAGMIEGGKFNAADAMDIILKSGVKNA